MPWYLFSLGTLRGTEFCGLGTGSTIWEPSDGVFAFEGLSRSRAGIISEVYMSVNGEMRVASGKIRKKIKKELIGTSDYPSNKIFTISNFITFLRLILTGVFLYFFVTDANRYVALAIYFVAASTDWLDGQIARMTKTVSWLGKMLDPVVDRALLFTGVVGLVARGELPLWICLVATWLCVASTSVLSMWCSWANSLPPC